MKVIGRNKAKSIKGVKEVYVKPRKGSILTPPSSMDDRYVYVLASSPDRMKVKEIAKPPQKNKIQISSLVGVVHDTDWYVAPS